MTRRKYEANSLSKLKPWEAEGISRRTWERRRAETEPLPPNSNGHAEKPVSQVHLSQVHRRQIRGRVASPSATSIPPGLPPVEIANNQENCVGKKEASQCLPSAQPWLTTYELLKPAKLAAQKLNLQWLQNGGGYDPTHIE